MRRLPPRVLIVSILLMIALSLLILNLSGFLQPVQNLVARPMISVQSWFALRFSALRDVLASPRDMATLRGEVNRLEAENALLQQEIISLREQAAEADVLAALLNYARSQPQSRYLATNVIGRDVSPFIRSILIEGGSDAGISRGMPVVTSRGLIGRVAEVFATYSRVQLITDPEIAVNIKFQESRTEGVLTAQLNGELIVDLIDLNAEISQGELVLTSGLGGKYPADIPIGRILSIHHRDYDLFQQATIQSSVEFDQLNIVLVITNFRPLIFEQPNP
ncbi:MAG: rod shape-determining protein MreC [Anaerolineales bacterium]|nr:MAG: rod shape-determining protein MreC [Anaerolineales bacterium]